MGEVEEELKWLEKLAARAREERPSLEGRTWRWWSSHHRTQAFYDFRESRRSSTESARRSWAQTSLRHQMAGAAPSLANLGAIACALDTTIGELV